MEKPIRFSENVWILLRFQGRFLRLRWVSSALRFSMITGFLAASLCPRPHTSRWRWPVLPKISKLGKSESVPCEVTDLIIREPLFLPEEDSCLIQLIFEESTEQGMGFRVCSRETSAEAGHVWRTHVTGRVQHWHRVAATGHTDLEA